MSQKSISLSKFYTLRKMFPYQSFSGLQFFLSPYSVGMRENTDQKKSEYRHFSRIDKTEKPRTLTNLLDFLVSKFCLHGMILKNYERQPLINVFVFRKYIVKMKFEKFSLFPVADANLQNKPYSCDIREYNISLTLMGAGMFVTLI